jgi:hypothetical protein
MRQLLSKFRHQKLQEAMDDYGLRLELAIRHALTGRVGERQIP